MSVIELLQKKFQDTGYNTVTDWMAANKVSLSLQSCTAVLLRGQDKGLQVMLTLASHLKCTTDELQWIAREKGDKAIWKLLNNPVISPEEQFLLDNYRLLNGAQQSALLTMIKGMNP